MKFFPVIQGFYFVLFCFFAGTHLHGCFRWKKKERINLKSTTIKTTHPVFPEWKTFKSSLVSNFGCHGFPVGFNWWVQHFGQIGKGEDTFRPWNQTLKCWSDLAKIGTKKVVKFGNCIIGSTYLGQVTTMILQLFVHFKDQNCIFYDKGGHHENKILFIFKCRNENY